MGLQGVEIFTNSSASHHELRKLDKRLALILEATRKSGGIYIYANLKGLRIPILSMRASIANSLQAVVVSGYIMMARV